MAMSGEITMRKIVAGLFETLVASTSLDTVEWQNSTLISGDVVTELTKLTQQPGKNLNITGSLTLVRSLLREGLLDELRVALVALGIHIGAGMDNPDADGRGDAVRLESVRKVYGGASNGVAALVGVTIGFAKGSFTAVMGPSGSGKSTLLQTAAGLVRPTSGSVVVAWCGPTPGTQAGSSASAQDLGPGRGNRQAPRPGQGLRPAPPPLGRGTLLRLADQVPPPRTRLRDPPSHPRSHDLDRHHLAAQQPPHPLTQFTDARSETSETDPSRPPK